MHTSRGRERRGHRQRIMDAAQAMTRGPRLASGAQARILPSARQICAKGVSPGQASALVDHPLDLVQICVVTPASRRLRWARRGAVRRYRTIMAPALPCGARGPPCQPGRPYRREEDRPGHGRSGIPDPPHSRLTRSLNSHMLFVMSEQPAEPSFDGRTYLPVPAAQDDVLDLVAALRARGRDIAEPRPRLVLGDGQEVPLPEPIVDVLAQVAEAMRAGLAVTIAPQHLALSTQEAADLLGISRMTVVRLLESGQIPFDRPGRHRRIRLTDLLEYRQRQRRHAEQALADMVADTERLGLYDTDPDSVQAILTEARTQRGRD